LAIIAIKDKALSSKSLFPKLSKHTFLMKKEGRKKVIYNVTSDKDTLSSDNYDSSDDDKPLSSELVKIVML
jgi:hypothetical protein